MGNETPPSNLPHGDEQKAPSVNVTTSTPHGDESSLTIEEIKQQLADLQRKNADVLSDNAKYRKKQKEQEEAAQIIEQQRLAEQGQFKQLAEQHEARVKELEPIVDRYSKLSEIVAKQIATQTKEWPAELKSFDPGPDAPIEQRLEWLEKFGPLLEKLQLQAKGNSPGNGPNPKPSPGTAATIEQSYLERLSAKYPKI